LRCVLNRLTEIKTLERFLKIIDLVLEINFGVKYFPAVPVLHYFLKISGTGSNTSSKDFLLVIFEAEAKLYSIEIGSPDFLYIGVTCAQR
jgi:hypothetical protein